MITALFQKGCRSTIPHASLSHGWAGGQARSGHGLPLRQTDADEVPRGPGEDGLQPRAGERPPGVSEDQPVSMPSPAPVRLDSPSDLALTIPVVFTAVLFFAYSYESCIIIIIILVVIVTSVS